MLAGKSVWRCLTPTTLPSPKLARGIAVLVFSCAWLACGKPPPTSTLADKEYDLEATLVILPPEENRGFSILDVPEKKVGDNIRLHWRTNFTLMCNGGFFDTANFAPAAFCRLQGKTVNGTISASSVIPG